MKIPANSAAPAAGDNPAEGGGEKKSINSELWQACAGPLVNLPAAGTHVIYFPQGHSEQVAASMKKDVDAQIPNYPNLPSQLLCVLHNVTLHADPETDEVYAQMTLQPVPSFDKEALRRSDLTLNSNNPQPEFFCKTLTASDTSTHGGFSVPRRAAEKIFPPLDFTMQPPAQELVARDLHDNVWTFRHIYRGQPKRHLLTTGWSLFVSGKRLFAGDSVLFIRDEKQQLLLGIRRANRQPANLSSSVLSSDSMHIGILAAAAHAAANNSPFTVFYNPRASPSEFVIPLAKYYKAAFSNQISLGMRFRMMFETEESSTRRYMGTITGISDLDPVRWKGSRWRNLQVGWDESAAGEKRNRVSIWEIEPVTAPFFICPPPFLRPKRPRQPGMPDDDSPDFDNIFKKTMPWLGDDIYMKDSQSFPGLSLVQWMNMQQNPSLANSLQPNYMQSLPGPVLPNLVGATDISRQLGLPGSQFPQPNNLQFNAPRQAQQLDQLPTFPSSLNPLGSVVQPQQSLGDISQHSRPNIAPQTLQSSQVQAPILQPQTPVQNGNLIQQSQQQPAFVQNQQNVMQTQLPDQVNQPLQMPPHNQIQYQLLQKLQQQQQSLLAQQSGQLMQLQDPQRQLLESSQGISRPIQSNHMAEMAQNSPVSLPQMNNARFSHMPQQPKFQQQQPNILSEIPAHVGLASSAVNQLSGSGNGIATATAGAVLSGVTEDVPSCSTSPSTNNFQNLVQPMGNSRVHRSITLGDDVAHSGSTLMNPSMLEMMPCGANLVKDLHQKSDIRPSVNNSKNQSHGFFPPVNGATTQTDYLDTSSSTTSVCVSQNDVTLQQNHTSCSYNQPSFMMGASGNDQISVPTNSDNILIKGGVGLGKGFSNNLSSGGVITNCENLKDPQHELSSSMVSQSFGVPDVAFNSIDSRMNDNSFLNNRGSWAPQPQFQRMRTYTKVYKRGAVGRSIDITRYSGYDELKQDLARRFGIEGQLEDRQRVGWKLVYVDHENDVLLVGDDPWEEFVNCVRCIKILSPQEVQQMSLEGDFDNSALPNHACSSSDNGIA